MNYKIKSAFYVLLVISNVGSYTPSSAQECRHGQSEGRPKVVGGDKASIDQWPGQAALRLHAGAAKQALYICGGAAINERWVATAAHCVADISKEFKGAFEDRRGRTRAGTLEVVLGVDDLDAVGSPHVYEVDKIVVREGYKNASKGRDIALIRLKRPYSGPYARLSLEAKTDPVTPPGAQVRVAGFGSLKFRAPTQSYVRADGQEYLAGSRRLLEATIPTVSIEMCAQRYPGDKIDAEQICAGLEEGGKDSCQGDSGGPLVAFDRKGCPYQIGVVSWGAGCAGAKDYGVYTRISHHAEWIISHAGPLETVATSDVIAPIAGVVSDSLTAAALGQLRDLLGPADRRVQLRVKGGNRVSLGKEVVFIARSVIAGRLVVLDVNAAGEVIQILPNKYTPAHSVAHIEPGVEIAVPGPGYGFTGFQVVPPIGKGRLISLVVPDEFPLDSFISKPENLAKGFIPVNTPTNYLMNVVQQVAATFARRSGVDTELKGWAMGTTEYEIVP